MWGRGAFGGGAPGLRFPHCIQGLFFRGRRELGLRSPYRIQGAVPLCETPCRLGSGPIRGRMVTPPPFLLGSPYYDNVRPLCYSDSDAVLLCFDISRPETLDSASKKVGGGGGQHSGPICHASICPPFPISHQIGGGGRSDAGWDLL